MKNLKCHFSLRKAWRMLWLVRESIIYVIKTFRIRIRMCVYVFRIHTYIYKCILIDKTLRIKVLYLIFLIQGSADTVAEATAVDLAIAYSKYVLDFIDYKVYRSAVIHKLPLTSTRITITATITTTTTYYWW